MAENIFNRMFSSMRGSGARKPNDPNQMNVNMTAGEDADIQNAAGLTAAPVIEASEHTHNVKNAEMAAQALGIDDPATVQAAVEVLETQTPEQIMAQVETDPAAMQAIEEASINLDNYEDEYAQEFDDPIAEIEAYLTSVDGVPQAEVIEPDSELAQTADRLDAMGMSVDVNQAEADEMIAEQELQDRGDATRAALEPHIADPVPAELQLPTPPTEAEQITQDYIDNWQDPNNEDIQEIVNSAVAENAEVDEIISEEETNYAENAPALPVPADLQGNQELSNAQSLFEQLKVSLIEARNTPATAPQGSPEAVRRSHIMSFIAQIISQIMAGVGQAFFAYQTGTQPDTELQGNIAQGFAEQRAAHELDQLGTLGDLHIGTQAWERYENRRLQNRNYTMQRDQMLANMAQFGISAEIQRMAAQDQRLGVIMQRNFSILERFAEYRRTTNEDERLNFNDWLVDSGMNAQWQADDAQIQQILAQGQNVAPINWNSITRRIEENPDQISTQGQQAIGRREQRQRNAQQHADFKQETERQNRETLPVETALRTALQNVNLNQWTNVSSTRGTDAVRRQEIITAIQNSDSPSVQANVRILQNPTMQNQHRAAMEAITAELGIGGQTQTPPAPQTGTRTNPARPASREEAEALAEGTYFIDGNGNLMVR